MRALLTFIILTCTSLAAFANFTVHYVKGNAEVLNKESKTEVLKYNMSITPGSTLKIKAGAEVILRDEKKRFCAIKKAGSFTYEELAKLFGQQQTNVTGSAVTFVGDQLGHSHKNIRDNSDENMKQKGGVMRLSCPVIMIAPGMSSRMAEGKITFKWAAQDSVNTYELVVYRGEDPDADVAYRTDVKDTLAGIELRSIMKNDNDTVFNWVAYPKDDPSCARYPFRILAASKIEQERAAVIKATSSLQPEEKLLQQTSLFEQRGLISDADKAYKDLNTKFKNPAYADLYRIFKDRNGL
jgi:hypothetical protein